MNYSRYIILLIPLFLFTHISWTMVMETKILDSQDFQDQIDGIKEKKARQKHKEKAKLFAKIGFCLPCFWCAACYHYNKSR